MSVHDEIQADEDDFLDEGFAASTTTSYLTSLASSIRKGIEENGRIYSSYGTYNGLPVDEEEQDRNDLQHYKIALILDNRLHAAPISSTPQNILDLGSGSGIWAIDMADRYPKKPQRQSQRPRTASLKKPDAIS